MLKPQQIDARHRINKIQVCFRFFSFFLFISILKKRIDFLFRSQLKYKSLPRNPFILLLIYCLFIHLSIYLSFFGSSTSLTTSLTTSPAAAFTTSAADPAAAGSCLNFNSLKRSTRDG